MKIMSIVTQGAVSVKIAKSVALAGLFALATACGNYTAAPVCNDANAVVPTGLTGTYTMTTQSEDFSTETSEFVVSYDDAKSRLTVMGADGAFDESAICSVNGLLIQENYDEELGAYEQQRVAVTGFGLSIAPMFYDVNELASLGIASKIIEVPGSLLRTAGKIAGAVRTNGFLAAVRGVFEDEKPMVIMVVRNEDVDARQVLRAAKTGPVSLNFIRK